MGSFVFNYMVHYYFQVQMYSTIPQRRSSQFWPLKINKQGVSEGLCLPLKWACFPWFFMHLRWLFGLLKKSLLRFKILKFYKYILKKYIFLFLHLINHITISHMNVATHIDHQCSNHARNTSQPTKQTHNKTPRLWIPRCVIFAKAPDSMYSRIEVGHSRH